MAARIPVLKYVGHDGEDFPLRPGRSYITGRAADADLVISEDTVSRKHARFYFARGDAWVRDLGSRNGTTVNGENVQVHRLEEGDRLGVGAHLFRVVWVVADSVSEPGPQESSGRSMSGNIRDIPLADVLQWLATSRKTGTLSVHGPSQGFLSLKEGRVCHARIDGREKMKPEKALLRMLGWQEGGFGLENAVEEISETDEISPSLQTVLMEAARQQDELAHLAERNTLPEGKVRIGKKGEGKWSELEPAQLDLLQAVAELSEWTEILDHGDSDDVELTKGVIALKKKGFVDY